MKFTSRLITLLTLVAVLPVVLMTIVSYTIHRDSLQRNMHVYLETVNLNKEAQVQEWIQNGVVMIEHLASIPALQHCWDISQDPEKEQSLTVRELREKTLVEILQPLIANNHFTELFLMNHESGKVVLSTDVRQIGKFKNRKDFFLKGRQQTYVDNVYFSMSLQQPSLTIGSPVRDGNGRNLGVLAARVNLQKLSEIMVYGRGYTQTEDSYLVNNLGFFITEPRFGKNFMLRRSVHTRGVERALDGENGVDTYPDYRGVQVIGAYKWLPELELVLLTEVDTSEYMAPVLRARNLFLLLGLVIVLLALLLGSRSGRVMVRPVNQLVEDVGGIQSDRLEFPVEKYRGRSDELGELATSFFEMTQRLRQTLVSRELLLNEVTRRWQAEQRLEQSNKELKQSNEELEQFAYVASHDLQEPLRMVSSYTQLLEDRYREQLDERAQRYIYYAADGARRMQQLIKDLLDFSRVTTRGKGFSEVDLGDVVEGAKANLNTLIREKGAEIISDELPRVSADGPQLVQLFQNLLSNGIKFCDKGEARIHISARREEKSWLITVKDNGIGVEQQYEEKIFVIFQRLHTREEYPGTGIGLAICKRIVERHGGKIWFESIPGEGTTFFFTLPDREISIPEEFGI